MGIGLDRLVMQLLGCESLRDVTAFPKVQNASEPMTECPAPVDAAQLRDLGLEMTERGG
jgi:aspartyl-tRNA synthetase